MKRTGAVAALAIVVACGGNQKPTASAPSAPSASASVFSKCPDLAKADEVGAFDFASEYHLSREAADKLKAATLAAAEINQLNDKLEGDLGIACASIAQALGNKSEGRGGYEMCGFAFKAARDSRARLSPKAEAQLVVHTPLCLVDASLMTKCASICDSSVAADRVKAECEQLVGRCDGTCDGSCELNTGAKCEGTCNGVCEGAMKGTCGGRCHGTCDGRTVNGPCADLCAGSCEKGATSGECKGGCNGTCTPKTAAICDGLCTGSCSVELSEPKCAGRFKAPDVSTECRARCELAVMNQTHCTKPAVGLVITHAVPKDRDTAEALRTAVGKSFPDLLEILYEIGASGPKRVTNAKDVIESARTGLKDLSRSGGKGTGGGSETQLLKCFDEHLKKASVAAIAVKAGLDQAFGVRDEVSR